MAELGNLSLTLQLNLEPLKNQMQAALNLLKNLQSAKIGDLGADPSGIKQLQTALEKTIPELDKAEKESGKLNKELENTGTVSKRSFSDTLTNIKNFSVLITSAYLNLRQLLGPIIDFGRESLKSFEQSEIALRKLQNGLKNVGEGAAGFEKLTRQAGELQKTTPFSDEQVMSAQSMLTTFMKSSDEIEILTPRILDLAAAYQTSGDSSMSLQQIAVMVGKVNEETVGQLRRVGVAFTQEQEAKLKSLKGTEQAIFLSQILDQNFKGMAETVGNTFAGKMKILSNAWDDVKEKIGGVLASALMPLANIVSALLPVIDNFISEIINLGKGFASAVSEVMGGNMTFEDFKKIVVDLVQSALNNLLKYLKDLEPAYLDLVKAIKSVIGEQGNLIDIIKFLIKAVFDLLAAFAKWYISIQTIVLTVVGWFRSLGSTIADVFASIWNWLGKALPTGWLDSIAAIVSGIKNKLSELINWAANNPVLRVLFPALNFESVSGPEESKVQESKGATKIKKKEKETESKQSGKEEKEIEHKKLNELEQEANKLAELKEQLELNKGIRGAELKILKDIEEIEKKIAFLKTGERPMTDILKDLDVGKQTEKIKDEMLKRSEEVKAEQEKIDGDINQKRIALIEDEFNRRREEIEDAYELESKRIDDINEATAEQKDKLRTLARTERGRKLKLVDEEETLAPFYKIKGIAGEIQNIFQFSSNTVFASFVQALGIVEQIYSLLTTAGIDFVNILGSILGFIFGGPSGAVAAIARGSGGSVPGSGDGDTVPALLTPGEFVIRKSRVRELISEYGSGFMAWLNGGGLLPAIAGRYGSGGIVMPSGLSSATIRFEVADTKVVGNDLYLSWKRTDTSEKNKLK